MMIPELREFKRQIASTATQTFVIALKNKATPTNPLSRETSPHANQILTEPPPSRETSPHPIKSMKKLAQALKKRIKYETERRTNTSNSNHSSETLAKTLKSSTKTLHPNPSARKLANALRQHTE